MERKTKAKKTKNRTINRIRMRDVILLLLFQRERRVWGLGGITTFGNSMGNLSNKLPTPPYTCYNKLKLLQLGVIKYFPIKHIKMFKLKEVLTDIIKSSYFNTNIKCNINYLLFLVKKATFLAQSITIKSILINYGTTTILAFITYSPMDAEDPVLSFCGHTRL